jgi:excinuclease ABC subunit C
VTSERIQNILANLPARPGVYLMKNAAGEIIYVGKALNLRNRVRSYFHAAAALNPKTRRLVADIEAIETWATDTEVEALLLECNLIKKHRPRYNIRLKDDKRYPYIKVAWQQPFPKVTITRRIETDGARYFGPYTSAWAVHQTLDTLRKVFPYLTCDRVITGQDPRACLYFDIHLCLAPCIGAVNQAGYRRMIAELCAFLEGRTEPVVTRLQAEMRAAAEGLQFERAAHIRDQLRAIDHIVEKQKVVALAGGDQDVVAFARDDGEACVQVFFIRQGKLIGREYFLLENTEHEDAHAILAQFLQQFYAAAPNPPAEVLLPNEVDEARIIEQWLARTHGRTIELSVPREGVGRALVEKAASDAADTLALLRSEWQADSVRQETALRDLQEALELPRLPVRIECYDISNTQGTNSVASMVVFAQGVARKSDYRRFNIRTVTGADDFASMGEVLSRRFQRWQTLASERAASDRAADARAGDESPAGGAGASAAAAAEAAAAEAAAAEAVAGDEGGDGIVDVASEAAAAAGLGVARRLPGQKQDNSFRLLPDLLLVDGGKGQLSVAVEVLERFGLREVIPVAGLAKRHEELFVPGRPEPIVLGERSPALQLVQRVRDEAHRFANSSHRARRTRVGLASVLEQVPGIGPTRRKALLARFGTLDAIRAASLEELTTVPGITAEVAAAIKDHL